MISRGAPQPLIPSTCKHGRPALPECTGVEVSAVKAEGGRMEGRGDREERGKAGRSYQVKKKGGGTKERRRGTWIQPSVLSSQQILTQAYHEHSARQGKMCTDSPQHPGHQH